MVILRFDELDDGRMRKLAGADTIGVLETLRKTK
jgi:hypothetical protein